MSLKYLENVGGCVMGRFEKYVGKTEFDVDGEHIILDFTVEDKIKLMSIQESKDKKYEKLYELLLDIFKRSYPEETEPALKGFLMRKFEAIIPELFVSLGLTTKEDIDESIKNMKEGFLKGKVE